MKKQSIILPAIIILNCLFTSGCSVYKAAQNEGVRKVDIKNCQTKECFLSRGMEKINTENLTSGEVVETYRAVKRKTGLNYVRAAGHGALDVMTLGLWEVAGTPIEGAISNNRDFIVVKMFYESADKVVHGEPRKISLHADNQVTILKS